jgi:hypothetical protein
MSETTTNETEELERIVGKPKWEVWFLGRRSGWCCEGSYRQSETAMKRARELMEKSTDVIVLELSRTVILSSKREG